MTQYSVTGMSCAACSARVEKAVSAVPGVTSCAVSLLTNSMGVDGTAAPADIIRAVEAAGYGASPADDAKRDLRKEQEASAKAMGRRLLWSVVCLVPLFYLSMGHMMGLPVPAFMHHQPLLAALVQLALCLPILILNRAYFTVGFSRLFQGSPNMDSLVALGAAAGLVYSLIEMGLLAAGQITGMPDLYFESAGMILALVTVGKYLEERSKGKTTGAITALLALAPDYIRGLSLLGGEPMEPQNRATVLSLVKKVREIYPRKTIWCYTGYDFDKDLLAWMEAGDPVITKLLPLLDVIVDGEYKEECRNLRLPFRGSENQRILDVPLSLKEKCGIILHT